MTQKAGPGDPHESALRELTQLIRNGFTMLARGHLQQNAYISLLSFLRPEAPFPLMGDVTIAADMGLLLASYIVERRPKVVLELGSGVSTLVAGYSVRHNQAGRVVSVEHNMEFLERTRDAVACHGLSDCVEIVFAPLEPVVIAGTTWLWYQVSSITETVNSIPAIELLFVDGPPGTILKHARYPALPVLKSCLAENCVVLADDARRGDEREVLTRWIRENPEFALRELGTIRGTGMLQRRKGPIAG